MFKNLLSADKYVHKNARKNKNNRPKASSLSFQNCFLNVHISQFLVNMQSFFLKLLQNIKNCTKGGNLSVFLKSKAFSTS